MIALATAVAVALLAAPPKAATPKAQKKSAPRKAPKAARPPSEIAEQAWTSAKGLGGGWHDYGWAPRTVRAGAPASLDLSDLGGWILARPGLKGSFGAVVLRFRAPASFGDFLEVRLDSPLAYHLPAVKIAAAEVRPVEGWMEAAVPLLRLNPQKARFDKVVVRAHKPVGKERVLIDAIHLTAAGAQDQAAEEPAAQAAFPTRPVQMRIDCQGRSHKISPLIYGVGAGTQYNGQQDYLKAIGASGRRWGGNHTSRYNWKLGNAWNTASDWFFTNANYAGRADYTYDAFLDENLSLGVSTALTVPTIGWVAKDTTSWAFPVSLLGPQQQVAPENPDAGNGRTADGKPIPPLSPGQTSVAMPPEEIERWVAAIRARDKERGRSVQQYILDNEPMLWNSTHRDVHPEPVTYDELLDRSIAYGSAVRRADPQAVIAGPAEWGWTGYFYSAADIAAGYRLHPDRLAHLNMPVLPWLLRRLREHEAKTGVRILDVVDVHFYPQFQGAGIGKSGDTSPAAAARRIRSTRALWDPTYKDESWIDDTVRLIPRLREWIAQNNPGLGISIGEWNFGAETHMSGGLAVAEVLGRFGVERITSAFYWDMPARDTPAFFGFRAFRNFDGKGGRFLDHSIAAEAVDSRVSLFASRNEAGDRVVAVLLNFDPDSGVKAIVDVGSCGAVTAQRWYTYVGKAGGFRELPVRGGAARALDEGVPPYSISVVEMQVRP